MKTARKEPVGSTMIPVEAATGPTVNQAALLIAEVEGVVIVKLFGTKAGAERELGHVLSSLRVRNGPPRGALSEPQLANFVRHSWKEVVSPDGGTTMFRLLSVPMAE